MVSAWHSALEKKKTSKQLDSGRIRKEEVGLPKPEVVRTRPSKHHTKWMLQHGNESEVAVDHPMRTENHAMTKQLTFWGDLTS